VGIGLPALPAIVQASRAKKGKVPWWKGFMAPPQPEGFGNADQATTSALKDQPRLATLHFRLRGYFELGTAYTMIAGLLNILAVYDAWGGPVLPETAKKEEDEDASRDEETKEEADAP